MGRIASHQEAFGPGAWLRAACAPAATRVPRLRRPALGGGTAVVIETGLGRGVASHLRLHEAGAAAWQDIAVFEGRVEALEWQGADLLLAFAAGAAVRVFSVFPGFRLRDASGPGTWRWLRLSTRRARR